MAEQAAEERVPLDLADGFWWRLLAMSFSGGELQDHGFVVGLVTGGNGFGECEIATARLEPKVGPTKPRFRGDNAVPNHRAGFGNAIRADDNGVQTCQNDTLKRLGMTKAV